jgi:murein DD-endopeptidase MepM/ murein hydrolase activator NlpD
MSPLRLLSPAPWRVASLVALGAAGGCSAFTPAAQPRHVATVPVRAVAEPPLAAADATLDTTPVIAPRALAAIAMPAAEAEATPSAAEGPAPSAAVLEADREYPVLEYLRERALMVPVKGASVFDVSDTFDAARGGGFRVHRAVDILAKRGTPVLAADDHEILAVRTNRLGGRVVYATDPARRVVYYYAHLDRWAEGLRAGQRVRQGDVIGYVGTTGNAPANTPHLHFQVTRFDDPKRYWDGTPLDPRPYFVWDGGAAGGR